MDTGMDEVKRNFEKVLRNKIENLDNTKLEKLIDFIIQLGASKYDHLIHLEKELKSCGLLTILEVNMLLNPSFSLDSGQNSVSTETSKNEKTSQKWCFRNSGDGAEHSDTSRDETFFEAENFFEADEIVEQSSTTHIEREISPDVFKTSAKPKSYNENIIKTTTEVEHVDFFSKLLTELNLDKHYLNKLAIIDAITIRNLENNKGIKIIQRILAADHEAHINKIRIKECRGYYHPMDIMTVIYNCCNQNLLAVLQSKLFVARVALPFIVPDQTANKYSALLCSLKAYSYSALLLSLHSIIPELKTESKAIRKNLAEIKQPIISFLRISKLARSKSMLLNQLFGKQLPDTFYHRDCPCGNLKRKLSNGLVELACNLPSKKKECNFKQLFTVLNLRGNSLKFRIQSKCMTEISSLVVIFVSEKDLTIPFNLKFVKDIIIENTNYLIALEIPTKLNIDDLLDGVDSRRIIKDRSDEGDEKLNDADWRELFVTKINSLLNQTNKLSDITKVQQSGINVSENIYKEINSQLDKITDRIHYVETKSRKEKLLPLQTQCWSEIAKLSRKAYVHKGVENISEYVTECHSKCKELRTNQIELYKSDNCFIKDFIKIINIENFHIISNLLKQKLDLISIQTLSSFKGDHVNKQKTECHNNEEFNKIISQASLGLEHIIREISQVYESHLSNKSLVETSIKDLPKFGAQMLLGGFPLEIMDGDNAYVPLDWVKAVFTELETLLGRNTQILIVSVLGIQSSGKSTMLNTMFGLQLAVSAGRCTKGVFCSLIPVDKTESQYDYDYIMVIDSEGLRAAEFGDENRNRDNELATFAIGLGDVAIVNIKGENLSEIQNTLEIVIHALIKLKKANKIKSKPTCMFVHQNVSGLNVEADLISHRSQLQNKLNKITKVAADREKEEFKKFDEIIELNDEGIFYIPDLWQGTPPMAYVNDGYIDKMADIKNFVLQTKEKCIKLESLKIRISDLWNALLFEDFVFSFRNSEELLAYDKLDAKLAEITWTAQIKFIELKEKTITELNNCDIKEISVKMNEFAIMVDKRCRELEKEMIAEFSNFFEYNEQKHILIKWENQTKYSINNFMKKESLNITDALDKEKKIIENKISNNATVSKYKIEFLNKAEKTAIELQKTGSATDEEVKKHFEEIWKKFIEKLASTSSDPAEDLKFLKTTFRKFLEPLFSNSENFYETFSQDLLEKPVLDGSVLIVTREDIKRTNMSNKSKVLNLFTNKIDKYVEEAQRLCCDTNANILANINSLIGQDINEKHIKDILIDELNKLFDCEKLEFNFDINFKDNLLLDICQLAFQKFVLVKRQFRCQNDSKSRIEKEKESYFMLFKNTYDNRTKDFIAANQVYNVVIGWFEHSIFRKMTNLIFSNVQNRHRCFQTKKTFLQEVLQRLLVKDSFDDYMRFIRDLQNCLIGYLNIITNEILNSKDSKYGTVFEAIIKKEILLKTYKFEEAFRTACETCSDLKAIFDHLKKSLQSELNMTENFETFNKLEISNSNDFKDLFFEQFEKIEDECWTRILRKKSSIDKGSLTYFDGKTPAILLSEHLIGCKEECPFCGSICDLTADKHASNHRCSLHRPQGVNSFKNLTTNKLIIENCSTNVDSSKTFSHPVPNDDNYYHPYKEYKKYFPNWDIPPDSSLESSMYWKRFMAKFNKELAKLYKTVPADIPKEWNDITIEEEKESLLKH